MVFVDSYLKLFSKLVFSFICNYFINIDFYVCPKLKLFYLQLFYKVPLLFYRLLLILLQLILQLFLCRIDNILYLLISVLMFCRLKENL